MADGTLHPAGGRPEGFRHLGIQHLRDGVDYVHVVYRDDDGLPQILVALDVGGNADLVDDARDHGLDAGLVRAALLRGFLTVAAPDLLKPLHQRGHIAGLQHQIPHPQIGRRRGHVLRHKDGGRQRDGAALHAGYGFQNADAVLLAQHQIQHQNVGLPLLHHANGLFPVVGRSNDLETVGVLQCGGQGGAEVVRAVRDQYGCYMFHIQSSPVM